MTRVDRKGQIINVTNGKYEPGDVFVDTGVPFQELEVGARVGYISHMERYMFEPNDKFTGDIYTKASPLSRRNWNGPVYQTGDGVRDE